MIGDQTPMHGNMTPMYGASGGRTPMYGSQTPQHDGKLGVLSTLFAKRVHIGSRTPHYGAQTPSHEPGARTPSYGVSGSSAWDPMQPNTPRGRYVVKKKKRKPYS